jgi:hypothetical protein
MSTPTGALAPRPGAGQVLQGQAVTPTVAVSPLAAATHDFCNLMRAIVSKGTLFRSENEAEDALTVIAAYEKAIAGRESRTLLTEDDPAPHEDVTQRKGAVQQSFIPTADRIDYAKLASAIVAAQAAQQAEIAQLNAAPQDGTYQ